MSDLHQLFAQLLFDGLPLPRQTTLSTSVTRVYGGRERADDQHNTTARIDYQTLRDQLCARVAQLRPHEWLDDARVTSLCGDVDALWRLTERDITPLAPRLWMMREGGGRAIFAWRCVDGEERAFTFAGERYMLTQLHVALLAIRGGVTRTQRALTLQLHHVPHLLHALSARERLAVPEMYDRLVRHNTAALYALWWHANARETRDDVVRRCCYVAATHALSNDDDDTTAAVTVSAPLLWLWRECALRAFVKRPGDDGTDDAPRDDVMPLSDNYSDGDGRACALHRHLVKCDARYERVVTAIPAHALTFATDEQRAEWMRRVTATHDALHFMCHRDCIA